MKTITLKINERSKAGKVLLSLVRHFTTEGKGVEVIPTPNKETINAMVEAKQGKTIKAKNSKELFKKLDI